MELSAGIHWMNGSQIEEQLPTLKANHRVSGKRHCVTHEYSHMKLPLYNLMYKFGRSSHRCPCICRYFHFPLKMKMEYEHTFVISTDNWKRKVVVHIAFSIFHFHWKKGNNGIYTNPLTLN